MENQIVLTNNELWFLLSKISPVTVIGFRNPMTGLLFEEISPIALAVLSSLSENKLITVNSQGQVVMNQQLHWYIDCLAHPVYSYLLSYRVEGSSHETIRSFHYSSKKAILLEELPNDEYIIKKIETKQSMIAMILEPFLNRVFWAPDSDPFHIGQEKLQAIQAAMAKGDTKTAKQKIEGVTGDKLAKQHLIGAFQNPKINLSFVCFLNRNETKWATVDGFAIIADERYIWLMEIVDEKRNTICVSKASTSDLENKVNLKISGITL